MQRLGGTIRRDPKTELLTVNDEFTVSLVIARCLTTQAGHSRWTIRLDIGLHPDLTVAVRMAEGNHDILDYYLPAIDMAVGKLRLADDNGIGLDAFRFASLDYLFGMAERVHARLPEPMGGDVAGAAAPPALPPQWPRRKRQPSGRSRCTGCGCSTRAAAARRPSPRSSTTSPRSG